MAFLDGRVQAGRDRQKQALIAEAGKVGIQIHEILDLDAGAAQAGKVVGDSLKSMFGGKLQIDGIQLFRLYTNGWAHAYVQPYSGFTPLPGEHYGVLPGSLPSPAIARSKSRRQPFDPNAGAEIAGFLGQSSALQAVMGQLVWEWPTGMATVELDWTVQLRSVGDGSSQLAMQSGRYGGLTTYDVGFAVWLRLCGAIHGSLAQAAWPAQWFPVQPRFVGLSGGPPQPEQPHSPAAQAVSAPQGSAVSVQLDYGPAIAQALQPHLGKRVWLGEGPAQKMANVRQHVLPGQISNVPLLAAIDLTTFGSAKDAIAVTNTLLIAKEFDDVICIELAAIRAVPEGQRSMASKVSIVVDGRGTMGIPVGIDFEPVHALLQAVARVNEGGAGPVHAEVSAFVGEGPGQLSAGEAEALANQLQAAMLTGSVDDKINAAARQLLAGAYQAAIDAYLQIAALHPERTGVCYGQIGAGLFFIGHYERAIEYYQAAKQHGADPRMMDDNIAEARGKLGG